MEAGMFERPHRRALYVSCSTEHISASQGTPYPCSQNDLDESIFGFYNPLEARRYPEEALVELESFFRPNSRISPEVEAAISHLQAALKIQDWKPDLIIKAFKDLDIVFFAGKLRGHTTFSWRCAPWWDEEEGIPVYIYIYGHRGPLGITRVVSCGKTAITLSAWGTLLTSPAVRSATLKYTADRSTISFREPTRCYWSLL